MAKDATLHLQQRHALAAYARGYISIGKLADALGMHVLDLRLWLSKHGIDQNTAADIHTASACVSLRPSMRSTQAPGARPVS